VTLRDAQPDEAAVLTQLALRSKRAWGYDDAFMNRIMPDMIVHPEYLTSEHGVVVEDGGAVCGYAIVRVDAESAYLRDLFVEPQHFRRGFGEALFHAAVAFAKKRGARRLTLVGDPNAVGFYERMGMVRIGDEPSSAGAGRMLPIMSLSW